MLYLLGRAQMFFLSSRWCYNTFRNHSKCILCNIEKKPQSGISIDHPTPSFSYVFYIIELLFIASLGYKQKSEYPPCETTNGTAFFQSRQTAYFETGYTLKLSHLLTQIQLRVFPEIKFQKTKHRQIISSHQTSFLPFIVNRFDASLGRFFSGNNHPVQKLTSLQTLTMETSQTVCVLWI